MAEQMKKKRQSRETGIWIPQRILDMKELRCCEKMLLSYIYSFGIRGCYQSNQTLGRVFNVSGRSISEWIKSIQVYLYFKAANGVGRTLWAKFHPAVVSRVRATRLVKSQQERIRATSLNDKKQKQTVTMPFSAMQPKCATYLATHKLQPVPSSIGLPTGFCKAGLH